ncbi:MAG: oxidoreductase, partial [Thiotrichales bacterium]
AADALDLRQLRKTTRGADFIFNGLSPVYTEWARSALPMARNVMKVCQETRATHLFPGNVYNYGHTIPSLCTEDTPFAASTLKGRIRVEMEKLFAQMAEKYKVKTLVLRAGDFYGGSGRGSWFDLVLTDKISKNQYVYPGPDNVIHSWAYLPDLARTFVVLAEQSEHLSSFEQFLFPGHSLTGGEFQALIENACDTSSSPLNFPWKLIRMGRFLVPMWREIFEVAYLWERPHRLDGKRLSELLGETPFTPPEVAVREVLTELKHL